VKYGAETVFSKIEKDPNMADDPMLGYVNAAAALLGVPLDAPRAARVADHLRRSAAMATLLDEAALTVDDEIAEIYSPFAFQPNANGREQL
jgi:hypothetical protein